MNVKERFKFAVGAMALLFAAILGTARGDELTFDKDVAPIFYAKCVTCHRPGEAAPMSLITYKDARPWAADIREKVAARVMPPWHADTHYGQFSNERVLSQKEIDTIVGWVKGGAAEGNAADLPAVPQFTQGWKIGQPDAMFDLPAEYQIPARGTIDYQYSEVSPDFKEDRWVRAAEIRAGDRAHVHHVIVAVAPPKGVKGQVVASEVFQLDQILPAGQPPFKFLGKDDTTLSHRFDSGYWVGGWAPGLDPRIYPADTGVRIPAGSTLIFQIHYTTNGTPGRDRTKIGLIFSKEPVAHEVMTGPILNGKFTIPPGESNQLVESEATLLQDVKVWSLSPHMHLRGKDMTYTAIYPDGHSQILLQDPKYSLPWQTEYLLKEPLILPKGTKIHVTAHFDNSANNPLNPDPAVTVHWGHQSFEEMMVGFFTYSLANPVENTAMVKSPR